MYRFLAESTMSMFRRAGRVSARCVSGRTSSASVAPKPLYLRRLRHSAATADDRTTFATVWQGVDENRHDGGLVTPDPLACMPPQLDIDASLPFHRLTVEYLLSSQT